MYTVLLEKRYSKQLRKLVSQKNFDFPLLLKVIKLLANGETLPAKYKDHALKGSLADYRELHVKHDLLLVYYKNETELMLVLVEVGTHGSLFGK